MQHAVQTRAEPARLSKTPHRPAVQRERDDGVGAFVGLGNQAILRRMQALSRIRGGQPLGLPAQEEGLYSNHLGTTRLRPQLQRPTILTPDGRYQSQAPSCSTSLPPPGAVQAKLAIGQVDDPLEHEADRAADRVMRMSAPEVFVGAAPVHVSRKCAISGQSPERPRFTRSASGEVTIDTPSAVQDLLQSAGQPLDSATRSFMEPRLGHDFGEVRVHADALASDASRILHARAFTYGNHIAFDAGEYRPGAAAGQALIAHELAHVLQQRDTAAIQRQPAKAGRESEFDFMLANIKGRTEVVSVVHPTDPAEFLQAFEKKGGELIEAAFIWSSNNLIKFASDAVEKTRRDPFSNINLETLRDISSKAYEKAVGSLAVKGAVEAGKEIINVIYIGKKVLYVGEKASRGLKIFGGVLASIGYALVQFLIGPLFDKSKELVKQAVGQLTEATQKLVNETIIPQVHETTTQFIKIMSKLTEYLLQDVDDPKQKPQFKTGPMTFSVGEGDYKITIEVDTAIPLTEQTRDEKIIDLANVVLRIDEVVPQLKRDLSLYQNLALTAGVFAGDVAKASPAKQYVGEAPAAKYSKSFAVREMVVGETRFDVPKGGSLAITSEARYDDYDVEEKVKKADYIADYDVEEWVFGDWSSRPHPLPWSAGPPSTYDISLYRITGTRWLPRGPRDTGRSSLVQVPRQYSVGKSETGEWYNLDEGKHFIVIRKGGNPNFTLRGNLQIEVWQP
jgi:hypothetical protein